MTLNNRFLLPRGLELQANYIRYASRNVPQGRERARSSLDLSAKNPLMNDRAEFVFTFTDVFNDSALTARHRRQWVYSALPELPGDADRDAGSEIPILKR